MSPTLDPGRLRDPALRPIAGKVLEGARLSPADARILYTTSDLTGLGRLADLGLRVKMCWLWPGRRRARRSIIDLKTNCSTS